MDILEQHLSLLPAVRQLVKTRDASYYHHMTIHPRDITANTTSIVMTSHERSQQVYYTLRTIHRSSIKDVQVILVDDSSNDVVQEAVLRLFPFQIDFIRIIPSKKNWANPCVNYNIGFEYVQGGHVVIQNSEVCHVGDVLAHVNAQRKENTYYVYDVMASKSFETNHIIYEQDRLDNGIYGEQLWDRWYQHSIHRNMKYHFLCAMSRSTFDKIDGFSYDYSFGSCYDDDDFLLKIKNAWIEIHTVPNEIHGIGGIHLFHGYRYNVSDTRAYTNPDNQALFEKKRRYLLIHQTYLELSEQSPEHIAGAFHTLCSI